MLTICVSRTASYAGIMESAQQGEQCLLLGVFSTIFTFHNDWLLGVSPIEQKGVDIYKAALSDL